MTRVSSAGRARCPPPRCADQVCGERPRQPRQSLGIPLDQRSQDSAAPRQRPRRHRRPRSRAARTCDSDAEAPGEVGEEGVGPRRRELPVDRPPPPGSPPAPPPAAPGRRGLRRDCSGSLARSGRKASGRAAASRLSDLDRLLARRQRLLPPPQVGEVWRRDCSGSMARSGRKASGRAAASCRRMSTASWLAASASSRRPRSESMAAELFRLAGQVGKEGVGPRRRELPVRSRPPPGSPPAPPPAGPGRRGGCRACRRGRRDGRARPRALRLLHRGCVDRRDQSARQAGAPLGDPKRQVHQRQRLERQMGVDGGEGVLVQLVEPCDQAAARGCRACRSSRRPARRRRCRVCSAMMCRASPRRGRPSPPRAPDGSRAAGR